MCKISRLVMFFIVNVGLLQYLIVLAMKNILKISRKMSGDDDGFIDTSISCQLQVSMIA